MDLVQLLTWNDYGESHYLGPIKGSQAGSDAWTNGYDHQSEPSVVNLGITVLISSLRLAEIRF